MRSAYNETQLYHLEVVKETKRWLKANLIEKSQFETIREQYASAFYHPNFIIRILIFIASLLGLSGVTGLLALVVLDAGETVVSIACMAYGIASFVALEKALIKNSHHYKSGVTEALLYHSCGFTIGGFAGLTDFSITPLLLFSIIMLSFAAFRYLDLLTTVAAFLTFAYFIFFEFYNFGGIFQQIIPFIFILSFCPIYLLANRLKQKSNLALWNNNLLIIESLSLIMIYLAGNYLVVRELSVNLMDLALEEGDNIPFAYLFYGLTIAIPVAYLGLGIKNKDMVLLRISLLLLVFSVFTFKYYYGFGHPEITLTVAGLILLGISLALFNYLKTIRGGFTRVNLLSSKWASPDAEAFIISQTMGGNQVKTDNSFQGQGGSFEGGGSSGSF